MKEFYETFEKTSFKLCSIIFFVVSGFLYIVGWILLLIAYCNNRYDFNFCEIIRNIFHSIKNNSNNNNLDNNNLNSHNLDNNNPTSNNLNSNRISNNPNNLNQENLNEIKNNIDVQKIYEDSISTDREINITGAKQEANQEEEINKEAQVDNKDEASDKNNKKIITLNINQRKY